MNRLQRTFEAGMVVLLLAGISGRADAAISQVGPQAGLIERQGMAALEVLEVEPAQVAPGAKLAVRIRLLSDLRPVGFRIEIDGREATVETVNSLGGGYYWLNALMPVGLKPGELVFLDVSLGQAPMVRAIQGIRVAEPLSIRSVVPRVATPGSTITIQIPDRPTSDSFLVSFDGLTSEAIKVAPLGSLQVQVPENILATDWRFHRPFFKVKTPALVVFSEREKSNLFTGLTIQASLLSGWWIALIVWVLLTLVSVLFMPARVWRLTRQAFLRRWAPVPDHRATEEPMEEEPLPPLEPPDGLVQSCAADECVVYVGAGLSAASGYPTWYSLVSEILEWAIEGRYVERDFGNSLRIALREGDADLVADSVIGNLDGREEALYRHFQEMFLRDERSLSRAHRLLREIPFCAALTTNFDELLEKTFGDDRPAYTPEDTDPLLDDLSGRRFFLLKLYGSLRRPSTLLVSPAQYQDSIGGNRAFSQAMESLFFSRTIFFIGASLQGIEAYLGGLSFRGIARRQHYALVSVTGTSWQVKADLLSRRYGIQVIPYQPSTAVHPEVLDFLSKLRDQVGTETKSATRRSTGPELSTWKSQALTRVRLENIGAFDALDVELDPRWTLLLGDNGVGKSTVLKAIATAICGKEAEPYAGTLIRTASRTARIVLSAGKNEYMATLVAREAGQAEIEVTPSRPLETEGWLAIGFPPLRTVTWARSRGPSPEGKRRPTAEDLLPLIKGGVDPRLDELKQWLVNLDYWSRGEPLGPENRYIRLRDEFFTIANDLTKGVPIRFKKVNEFTHEVRVETEDGEVRIEAVSQGTASLIGWTGFLLQRLHEVYGQQNGDPRQRYALVLIDELDAHMHPAWQQALVEGLTKAFPGVQFLASTHSPLIAGSLPRTSVLRFRRENGRVVAGPPPESLKGWRVDQILTSPLFGLQSGRESETERQLLTYTELAGRDDLDEKDQRKLQEAAEALKVRMLTLEERQEAQAVYDLLESAMRDRLRSMQPEEQEKILTEAKVQLQEAVTGSRRPT
jgi:hypothetical protein